MEWRALGDSAWLAEPSGIDARHKLQQVLRIQSALLQSRIPEVLDIVVSFESIAVHFHPTDGAVVFEWLSDQPANLPEIDLNSGRLVEIPVDYHDDSSELEELARILDMSPDEIVSIHSSCEYQVAAIGFSPGFPYLLGLDPRLSLPRKSSPRPVAAGSVAIAGGQAGIYPVASQGGWHVLGRTNALLFDANHREPTLLQPGDRVKFVASRNLSPPPCTSPSHIGSSDIEVLDPGHFSTIQDLGRPGHRSTGVTCGGAADPIAARISNKLVGNPDHAAVIECAGSGPVLKFHKPAVAAWFGWSHDSGRPQRFREGDVLDLRSRMCFSRGYVAVAGGIDVPMVLDSRSTDARAGFGGCAGRPLRRNDHLPIGPPPPITPSPGAWHVAWPCSSPSLEIRFLSGMQVSWFTSDSRAAFLTSIYQATSTGDRTGMRIAGPRLHLKEPRELVSQPVVCGSIQVPPDGTPIILLPECQTIGGYPQIGHIISADLPALTRALPGTPVTFREVDLNEARQAWLNLQRDLSLLQTGLSFLPHDALH